MKSLPTQSRALEKRAALIQAAVDEFSNAGYETATAKTIAAKAGVATGTFYQYFENKGDILRVIAHERGEFLQQRIEELDIQVTSDAPNSIVEDRFERVLRFVYEFHLNAPDLHQVLEQRRMTDELLRKIMSDSEALIKLKILSFVQSFNKPNPEIVTENLFAMGEGIVHRLVFDDTVVNVDEAIKIGAQMIASYFKP